MKTDSAQIQYDKMTKTPVNKLVLQLGLPTTVSMLVTSVYNMADTFFVSQLGTSVSGATGVVFALMAIINAFGFMFGHGAGSNISRKLGAHDVESARKFASTSFFLSFHYYVAPSFASLAFSSTLPSCVSLEALTPSFLTRSNIAPGSLLQHQPWHPAAL